MHVFTLLPRMKLQVLRNMGQGIGILVTKFPKETTASYSLREPAEVCNYIQTQLYTTTYMHMECGSCMPILVECLL
jgi:hypothetical protein